MWTYWHVDIWTCGLVDMWAIGHFNVDKAPSEERGKVEMITVRIVGTAEFLQLQSLHSGKQQSRRLADNQSYDARYETVWYTAQLRVTLSASTGGSWKQEIGPLRHLTCTSLGTGHWCGQTCFQNFGAVKLTTTTTTPPVAGPGSLTKCRPHTALTLMIRHVSMSQLTPHWRCTSRIMITQRGRREQLSQSRYHALPRPGGPRTPKTIWAGTPPVNIKNWNFNIFMWYKRWYLVITCIIVINVLPKNIAFMAAFWKYHLVLIVIVWVFRYFLQTRIISTGNHLTFKIIWCLFGCPK